MEYRALKGFTYAVIPNFMTIAANLPSSMGMMDNVCLWSFSNHRIYFAKVTVDLLMEAGFPNDVIDIVYR